MRFDKEVQEAEPAAVPKPSPPPPTCARRAAVSPGAAARTATGPERAARSGAGRAPPQRSPCSTSRLCRKDIPSAICAASDSTSGRLGGPVLAPAFARSSPRSIAACAPSSRPRRLTGSSGPNRPQHEPAVPAPRADARLACSRGTQTWCATQVHRRQDAQQLSCRAFSPHTGRQPS